MTKKAQTQETDEFVSKYIIECKACGKHWRDKRRDKIVEKALKKNPNYLEEYVCRNCKKIAREQKFNAFKNQYKTVETKQVETMIDNVTKTIPDGFNGNGQLTKEDLKQFIPSSAETYINRDFAGVKDVDVLNFHYKSKDPLLKNVLFIGDTGTGKTAMIRHFCWQNKIPYYRVVMNAGTTPEDIIGQWVANSSGSMEWHYQVLVLFMKYGGIFVFDEINAGQKEMLHILNSITDFERKAIVTQHKGEVVEACEDFLVVACMNPPQEYDLQEMSKSLKSRFTPYYFDYDEDVDKKVLGKEKKLLEFAKTIRLARNNGEIETPLSTRDLVHFQRIRDGLGYKLAKEMLINKFHNGEKNVVRTQMEVIMEDSTILKSDEEVDDNETN